MASSKNAAFINWLAKSRNRIKFMNNRRLKGTIVDVQGPAKNNNLMRPSQEVLAIKSFQNQIAQDAKKKQDSVNFKQEMSSLVCSPSKITDLPTEIPITWDPARTLKSITCGLENMGNTCYLNSLLQIFVNTPYVYYSAIQESKQGKMHECVGIGPDDFCIECAIIRLSKIIRLRTQQPWDIIGHLRFVSPIFDGNQQQDSSELYLMMLEKISTNFQNKFKGCYETKITFSNNGSHVVSIKEPFFQISLIIKSVPSLQRAFDDFFSLSPPIADYFCEKCNKAGQAFKQIFCKEMPEYLVISLNRFDELSNRINQRFHIEPVHIFNGFAYKLYGIIEHEGSLNYGHYKAFVLDVQNEWYEVS